VFLTRARLIKRVTDDGMFKVFEDVPIGREYVIDLDSLRSARFYNINKEQFHTKDIVNTQEGGFLPMELLEIEP
jgi:hypothetical protein